MPTPPPLQVDPSNRQAHYYLKGEHECFFFHEYTPREGPRYSSGNQFVYNLKKSVLLRGQPQYQYKLQAIAQGGAMLRAAFEHSPWVFEQATFSPIPPSEVAGSPEYDDRMTKVVSCACAGKGADVRELIMQGQGYEASHRQANGVRLKPHQLEAIYTLPAEAPRGIVVLIDDVLTTGAHFVAARNVILARYPGTRVIGFFLARRVLPDPLHDFDAL